MPTDERRLQLIADLRAKQTEHEALAEQYRQQAIRQIYDAFPENRGEDTEPARGWITKVVKAADWTRAYVDNIRHGTLTEDGNVIPANPKKKATDG